MKWKLLENVPVESCWDLVTFRGQFYASFCNGSIVVIDPFSLDVTLTIPSSLPSVLINWLVPCGNDELFLVEIIGPPTFEFEDFSQLPCRVSRLDEEAGKWVVVAHVGDRVLFIHYGDMGNVCCSAKELPDGCGVTGNSIVITDEPGRVTYLYKYGVDTGNAEDDLSFWRSPRDTCVRTISRSPMYYHLRVTLET
ncbi:unnamed protein product [Microthlaspi erraticum]|uniref:KIB1-4 beta-propeller domain-containing protein n=1 Tax=Microthlaspi erraticum TaxID=1685480 RepID=A0A6D2J6X0_9BRAS|nr:unnamed protein product [Microthlaspi erraticum]